MNETKLFEVILNDFPVYPWQATIKLFMFDLAQSKQDFANLHVSRRWNWAKYTQGSPGILELIV